MLQAYTGHFPFAATQLAARPVRDDDRAARPGRADDLVPEALPEVPGAAPRHGARGDLRGLVVLPDDDGQPPGEGVRVHARETTRRPSPRSSRSTTPGSAWPRPTSSRSTSSGSTSTTTTSWARSPSTSAGPAPPRRAGTSASPSPSPTSFRRRIADDMAADVEFFEFARELYHRRSRTGPPGDRARHGRTPPRRAPLDGADRLAALTFAVALRGRLRDLPGDRPAQLVLPRRVGLPRRSQRHARSTT